jgi:hypothetical protein
MKPQSLYLRTEEENAELRKVGEQIKARLTRIFEAKTSKTAVKSSKSSKNRLFRHN